MTKYLGYFYDYRNPGIKLVIEVEVDWNDVAGDIIWDWERYIPNTSHVWWEHVIEDACAVIYYHAHGDDLASTNQPFRFGYAEKV